MLDKLRRRRIIVPGITPVERMVGRALVDAEHPMSTIRTVVTSASVMLERLGS